MARLGIRVFAAWVSVIKQSCSQKVCLAPTRANIKNRSANLLGGLTLTRTTCTSWPIVVFRPKK
jgi:hypothetical protein